MIIVIRKFKKEFWNLILQVDKKRYKPLFCRLWRVYGMIPGLINKFDIYKSQSVYLSVLPSIHRLFNHCKTYMLTCVDQWHNSSVDYNTAVTAWLFIYWNKSVIQIAKLRHNIDFFYIYCVVKCRHDTIKYTKRMTSFLTPYCTSLIQSYFLWLSWKQAMSCDKVCCYSVIYRCQTMVTSLSICPGLPRGVSGSPMSSWHLSSSLCGYFYQILADP